MTEILAEKIIKYILERRGKGISDDGEIIAELKKQYDYSDEELEEFIEMMNTGAFRASIMSSGIPYPKSNIKLDDHIVLKTAFKMCWIDLKGEEDYRNNFEKKQKRWWDFFS